MQRFIIGSVFAFVALLFGSAHAANVKEIVVFENSKTTDDTVIYIANVDKGDDVGPEDLQKIKERLVSSGLFKEVEVILAAFQNQLFAQGPQQFAGLYIR